MANRLNYDDLLKYMEIVLDMEKNVYIELKSWQDLQGQMNRLGITNNYNQPSKYKANFDFLIGLAPAGITVIIGFILFIIIGRQSMGGWEFDRFMDNHDLYPLIMFGMVFIGIPILSLVWAFIFKAKDQKDLDKEYQYKLSEYNQNVANDKARVQKELAQKQYLQTQADTLAAMWRTSKERLDKMYSYNILEEKYRNIVAVASIYEYLKHERTRSLQRVGSDEGAYNIFESEVRLNKIITNTDIIIQKLDVVIENQRELANTMRNAQNSINNLVTSTNNMSARIQSGMNRLNASVELSNYQQQQTNNELRYMNFMNTLHFYS